MPNRRSFLKTSAALTSLGSGLSYWTGTSVLAADATSDSPNEQPVIAFIGTGIRYHSSLGKGALKYGPCAAVCDVDLVQAGRALQVAVDVHRAQKRPIDVSMYEDYRKIIDRQDVDLVVIGTTDHWHTKIAIEAMQAGKDVYCEKPLTLTIREGQQILETIAKTGRVMQVGTQQRTEYDKMFAKAAALTRAGRAGNIKRVTICIGGSRDCEPLPVAPVPRQLNWDMWLGQAPMTDYREGPLIDKEGWGAGFPLGRGHRYFRWWYEYSGGKLTDWGAHHVDIAMWALDKLHGDIGFVTIEPLEYFHPVPFVDGYPTQNDRFNAALTFKVRVTFADGVEMMVRDTAQEDLGFGNGILFEGSKGRFLVNRGKLVGKPVDQLKEDPLPEDALEKLYGGKVPKNHMDDFMDCVKTRETPASDVASHHRMISICHAINIAMRLDRKLTFDPKKEEFVGDPQANTFLEREQRKGYEINV
ncbi:MAG: Gfo/Idh/MocA family oxidoreductase [Planctomycetota bacterium]